MVATVPDADDVLFGEGMLKVFQLPNGVLDVIGNVTGAERVFISGAIFLLFHNL